MKANLSARRKILARVITTSQVVRMTSSTTEPTPQEKALKRILRISLLNGWCVIVFAALGSLITLAMGDFSGLIVGFLIGAAGWMEIRGHKLLKQRQPEGMRLLVRSQLLLLAVVMVCVSCSSPSDTATSKVDKTSKKDK